MAIDDIDILVVSLTQCSTNLLLHSLERAQASIQATISLLSNGRRGEGVFTMEDTLEVTLSFALEHGVHHSHLCLV